MDDSPDGTAEQVGGPPAWLDGLEYRVTRWDLRGPLQRLLGRSSVHPGVQDPFARAAGGPALLTIPLMLVLGLLTLPPALAGLHDWLPFVVPAAADAVAAVALAVSLRVRSATGTLTAAGRADRRLVGCLSALVTMFSLPFTPVLGAVAAVAAVLLLLPAPASPERPSPPRR